MPLTKPPSLKAHPTDMNPIASARLALEMHSERIVLCVALLPFLVFGETTRSW